VYVTGGSSVTITLPSGTGAFYFYAEPQQFATLAFTATAQDGTSSGPILVNGNAGARYFGFYVSGLSATPEFVASVTITTTDPTGLAVGEFGVAAGSCTANVPHGHGTNYKCGPRVGGLPR
jgi:hypothetical protein